MGSIIEGSPTPGFLINAKLEVVASNIAARRLGADLEHISFGCFRTCTQQGLSNTCSTHAGDCVLRTALRETIRCGTVYRGVLAQLPVLAGTEVRQHTFSLWTDRLSIDGEPHALVWCKDITEFREREVEIHRAHLHFRGIVEKMPDGVLVLDHTGVVLFANRAACDLFQTARQEMIGSRFGIPYVRSETTTLDIPCRNGDVRYAEVRLADTQWEGRPALLAMLRDVTEQVRMEHALTGSESRFRALFDAIGSGVVTCRRDEATGEMIVLDVNAAAASLENVSRIRAVGVPLEEVLPEFRAADLRELLERVTPERGFEPWGPRWVEAARRPGWRQYRLFGLASGEISIVYEDVTEKRRTEEAFQEAQRLDAIGKLAGGIAHEFNNTLQTLLAAIEILRLRPKDISPDELLSTIEARIRHGSALVRQLLLVGRRSVAKPERVDLGPVIEESCALLRRVVRENIELACRVEAHGAVVLADRGQLDQILVNLVTNAADALPQGGRIDVVVREREGRAELVVSDDGPGIPLEIRDRIFEPFFTTKPRNEGTGLGLAVVHGIVDQYEGSIDLESEPGCGTTFRIRLPLAAGLLEPAALAGEPATRCDLPRGEGRRVLLIEDEEGPRETLLEMLSLLDYDVRAVASAEAALEVAAEGPFDLLLTDFMLPGQTGREVANTLRARWPGLRAIVMSGYAEDEGISTEVALGHLRFLQKPFSVGELARELQTLFVDDPLEPVAAHP